MKQQDRVWAMFSQPDQLSAAVSSLRAEGHVPLVYTPVMTPEIDAALGSPGSAVRVFALVGSVGGILGAIYLTVFTAQKWGLITGGKPIISVPPYAVIAFEFAILFGALATAVGFLVLAGLPSRRRTPEYDPALTVDRYAIKLECSADAAVGVERLLLDAGAENVRRESPPGAASGNTERNHGDG